MDGDGQSGTSMIEVHGEGKCVYGDLEIDKNDVNRFQVVVLNLDDEPEESEKNNSFAKCAAFRYRYFGKRKGFLQDEFGLI